MALTIPTRIYAQYRGKPRAVAWYNITRTIGGQFADVFQDIVRRSPDLDHLTVTMAFTCSKMRVDGFGGLAMLITAETIRSESTNTLFDRFYKEAQANGEIGRGNP